MEPVADPPAAASPWAGAAGSWNVTFSFRPLRVGTAKIGEGAGETGRRGSVG